MSPEVASQIAAIRQRDAEGTATPEDYKLAIRIMREDRRGAQRASDSSRRKTAKAAIPDADSMLDELGGLT